MQQSYWFDGYIQITYQVAFIVQYMIDVISQILVKNNNTPV